MSVKDCQREMRSVFAGGFAGQLISSLIWLLASVISVLYRPGYGMAALFFGSMFIFPLTQGLLRLIGSPAKVSPENKLWGLGTQTAFTVPLNFLLVGAATLYRENWFFPAAMIVGGAHYLPFVTLYGMRMFAILTAILVGAGTGLALYGPDIFSLGGWSTGIVLILFALLGRTFALRERKETGIIVVNAKREEK